MDDTNQAALDAILIQTDRAAFSAAETAQQGLDSVVATQKSLEDALQAVKATEQF